MSITASYRLFSTKFPHYLNHIKTPIPKTPISPTLLVPPNFSFFKSISIQRIPTKPPPSPVAVSSSSAAVPLQPIEDLPPKLREIVKLFQAVQEPKAKYEQLLFYGRNLSPLDSQYKTPENKVQGCVSQVWVRAILDPEKNVVFEADSDSVLTKGLAALLVLGLSGRPVDEILRVSPDFAVLLGLQQSLTPSRNNGFLNMLKLMQKKALQLYVEAEKGGRLTGELSSAGESKVGVSQMGIDNSRSSSNEFDVEGSNVGVSEMGNENSSDFVAEESKNEVSEMGIDNSRSNSNGYTDLGSRGERIREKLEGELRPSELVVEDISYQHAGHAGVRGSDGETHFNVKVVSEEFEGKSLVKRHRLIYQLLQDELLSGLHALSIVAKTPSEVDSR